MGQPGRRVGCAVLAPKYLSADRRFRNWEDVVLDSLACNYEDHPVTRRDESDISPVEVAALHHELAVDTLRWFSYFAASDAINQGLIQIWYTAGTGNQLNLGGVAAMEELARQIRSHVYAKPTATQTKWAGLTPVSAPVLDGQVATSPRLLANQGVQGDRNRSATLSWNLGGAAGDSLGPWSKIQALAPCGGGRPAMVTRTVVEGVDKEAWRRCGWSHGYRWNWRGAAVTRILS